MYAKRERVCAKSVEVYGERGSPKSVEVCAERERERERERELLLLFMTKCFYNSQFEASFWRTNEGERREKCEHTHRPRRLHGLVGSRDAQAIIPLRRCR